jgi:hypothetical protein
MTYNQWHTKMYDGRYTINTWPKHQKATLDKMSTAERIAWEILRDVKDRRGWRQEWDQFDTQIRNQIFAAHVKIVETCLLGVMQDAIAKAGQKVGV